MTALFFTLFVWAMMLIGSGMARVPIPIGHQLGDTITIDQSTLFEGPWPPVNCGGKLIGSEIIRTHLDSAEWSADLTQKFWKSTINTSLANLSGTFYVYFRDGTYPNSFKFHSVHWASPGTMGIGPVCL